MVGTRDTPPSVQDGKLGLEPGSVSNFESMGGSSDADLDTITAKKLALECYEASTNWLNSGRRARWNDNLRAFQSLHPSGSKYLSRDYSYRSTLYRPKTRAMVRKAEAQTGAAFFSNEDVVSIQATDDDDPRQQASADFMQELLQYRLTKSIPWFPTLIGARQDAEVMGVCIGKVYWRYEERKVGSEKRPRFEDDGLIQLGDDGEPAEATVDLFEKVRDEPVIDLVPAENFRFEPGADWRRPAETSPYLIELVPMYIQDVRAKVQSGEWLPVSDSAMRAATDLDDDVTRRARETGRVPGKDHDAWKPRDFDIAWVRENIIRWGGRDWHFFTLGSAGELLTEPQPLEDVYLTGDRPYVVGTVVVETHKSYPSSKVELVRDLQRAANDDWNLRFDSVKMGLNPRQFVRAGSGVEINDLRTFAPGKVVLIPGKANEPLANNVLWDRPPDATAASYAEQDRINLDFDEMVGDFSNSSVQASQIQQQSATGMHLMSGQASGMNEYELRVFAETFVEPLIRKLVKLEQVYETDPVILAIAGKRAQLIQKYGVDQITDDLLNQELTIRVNVGIGATNPEMKLKHFMMGAQILGNIFGPAAAMGSNFEEVAKEIFGHLGYKDGARFFQPGFDPRVAMMQAQLAKAQGKSSQSAPQIPDQTKVQAAQITAQSRDREAQMRMITALEQQKLELYRDMLAEQHENWRTMFNAEHDAMQARAQAAVRAQQPHPAIRQFSAR